MDKSVLKEWLKAGYMEKNVFHQTPRGCPQGGLCKALHNPLCKVGRYLDFVHF